jgi:replicative DNA helicase
MNFQKDRHYSPDLERAIIGACMIEKTAFGRVYGILQPEIFYLDDHQIIWKCIYEMWENDIPIDILTVVHELIKKGYSELQAGNTPWYVTRCTREVVSTANLEYHSLMLREMYIDREMIKITNSGMNDKDTMQFMDELQEKMQKLKEIKVNEDFKTWDELSLDLITHMDYVKDKELTGITTGFQTIDRITGGLMPGASYVIAARPGIGKSALMGKMIISQVNKGINVAVISLEMPNKEITARLSSLLTDIEFWRIYRNRMIDEQQTEHFYKTINSKSNLPIRISDTAKVDMNDIKAKVAKLKQHGQIDILYIDYLQLVETERETNKNREQEVAKLSKGFKILAKEYDIPVVTLCQLNRQTEQGDKKPKLYHLRESGAIEQDADAVIFLHRDFMSGITTNADGSSTENEADLIIPKWRNCALFTYKIGFDGSRMNFYEKDQQVKAFIPLKDVYRTPYKTENFDEGFEEK